MDTPNTQNNTSRMRESRKLEQKRKRQQQVRRQKIFLACSTISNPAVTSASPISTGAPKAG